MNERIRAYEQHTKTLVIALRSSLTQFQIIFCCGPSGEQLLGSYSAFVLTKICINTKVSFWTGGRGDHEEFALVVRHRCTVHAVLPDVNSTKGTRALYGI